MSPRTLPDGQFQTGYRYRRKGPARRMGRQQQGGLSTPAGAEKALLFTGDSDNKDGSFDTWLDTETYGYCGEGQAGGQRL